MMIITVIRKMELILKIVSPNDQDINQSNHENQKHDDDHHDYLMVKRSMMITIIEIVMIIKVIMMIKMKILNDDE